jgi:hypothetical protein
MRRATTIMITTGMTIGMGTLTHMITVITMTGVTVTRTATIMATEMGTIIRIAMKRMQPPPAGRRSTWSAASSPIMTSTPP